MAQSWHPIASISPADFDGFDDYTHEGYARINEADCISSYNWLDKEEETPTIVVPGMPRLWTPRIGPTVMPADFSQYFESEHAFRHSQSRLEPLFRAVYCSEPMFDINTVDVVAERGSLRRLMRFINPRLKSADGHDFKLHFEVNNKTLLISRGEGGKSTYTISKHQSRTNPNYGHTFENFYSTNLIPGSTSHYRVMKYGFGSLNVLVCDETDGFVQDRYIYYADPTREEVIPADPGLDVFDEGKRVPQESILEMKTRGKKDRKSVV